MRKEIILILCIFGLVLITGCNKTLWIDRSVTKTVNNTFYVPSQSFALQDFADSCSFVSSTNVSNLSCVTGDVSFVNLNQSSGVWTMSCCYFKTSKCSWYNTSDIVGFNESKQFADSILSAKVDAGFGVMCCNKQQSQCFFQKPSLNGSYQSCDKEYDQIFASVSFNVTTSNWSVTSCLDGFK